MNRRLASIGVILRKDILTLWPLAAPTVALLLLKAWYGSLGGFSRVVAPPLISGLVGVLSVLLIFTVVQNDAPASARHDWLTRPIRRLDMVLAKLIFVLGAVGLPWLIGDMIYKAVVLRFPFGEILLAGSGELAYAAILLPIVILASVTANKVEAVVAIVGMLILFALVSAFQGALPRPAAIVGPGMTWFRTWMLVLVIAVACGLALWLQYGRRGALPARLAIVGAMAFWAVITFLPPPSAQASEPTTKTASAVEIIDPSVCAAGNDAGVVLVSGHVAGLPQGWTIAVDRLDATYVGAGKTFAPRGGAILTSNINENRFEVGRTVYKPNLAPDILQSDWMMSEDEARLAVRRDVALHLRASLTLLRPVKTYRFPADGQPHRITGFGYCSAWPDPGPRHMGWVNCLNVWPTPAKLTARFASQPATCLIDCGNGMVYAPVWAQAPIVRSYGLRISGGAAADDAVVTTYEIAGRVRRELTIPGPAVACPAPPTPRL